MIRQRAQPVLPGALLLAFAVAPIQAQPSVLRGVDLYRSHHVTTATLQEELAPILDRLDAAGDAEAIGAALGGLGRSVRSRGPFAYLDLSPIQYLEQDTTVWYVTVDVVDSADAHRLDFQDDPAERFPEASHLLDRWREFETVGWERRAFWGAGEPCPAQHCLFSFADPNLTPYADELAATARKNATILQRVLAEADDPGDRAAAAFLLAHHPDPKVVARAMLDRLRDPSPLVRNNAMRVLAFMVREKGLDVVPMARILRLVDGPSTTDRNKALAIVDALADDPVNHPGIVRGAGVHLLRLLELQQPNNHDFAYSILRKVSGLDLGPRDYEAWAHWLAAYRPRRILNRTT